MEMLRGCLRLESDYASVPTGAFGPGHPQQRWQSGISMEVATTWIIYILHMTGLGNQQVEEEGQTLLAQTQR